MKYWMKYKYKNYVGNWLDDDCFALNVTDLLEKRTDLKREHGNTNVVIELIVVL